MKKLSVMLSVAIVMAMVVSSCKKYEDGPMFSLASKKGRVAGTWEIEKAYAVDANGTEEDLTEDWKSETKSIEFTKDGGVVRTNPDGDIDSDDTWEFADKKETLTIKSEDGDLDFTITKLKQKELWLKSTDEDLVGPTGATFYLQLKQ